jgi:hypothetical protein
MAGVSLPDNFKKVSDELIFFKSEYKGKSYFNIRKTYEKDEETYLGKGLTISEEDFNSLKDFFKEL